MQAKCSRNDRTAAVHYRNRRIKLLTALMLVTGGWWLVAARVIAAGENDHWAFKAPVRPAVPEIAGDNWSQNAIDRFVLAELARQGMEPSEAAERTTLIRRLSLDLVGLPPTLKEIDAFVADESPDAVSRVVDRLLASPHYGEKWGRQWLDAARYADSDGFEKDKPRRAWFYRDWVVRSLNRDLPYNQFLIEQIAGDLLPEATQDQLVATGFLRNSMLNEEGGADPEQFRMEAMFDRMDAIGKAMLGLTTQCAQCHDHKYDPLEQREYYEMFAMLNNFHEAEITVYTAEQMKQRQRLLAEIAAIETELQSERPQWQEELTHWAEYIVADLPSWTIVRPELDASGGQKHYLLDDGSVLAQGYAPTKHATEFNVRTDAERIDAIRLELLTHDVLPRGGPGRSVDGLFALSEFKVQARPLGDSSAKWKDVALSEVVAAVNPPVRALDKKFDDRTDNKRTTGPASFSIDGDDLTAWSTDIGPGRSNVSRQAIFRLESALENEQGFEIKFTLVQKHGGWNSDDNQNNNLGRFRFSVGDAEPAHGTALPLLVEQVLRRPVAEWCQEDWQRLFTFWRTTQSSWQYENERIEALWKDHPLGSAQLVALERDEPRETYLLDRGDFLKPTESVVAGVPDFLHGMPADAPRNRLGLARWIADRRSPTTARAMINRIWQGYFGRGLVETSEDLGTQGTEPTHPQLLDWLAVELMENDWSLKHIHRLITTSATYQQSSAVGAKGYAADPENRWLGRGPRFRVNAETVRDIALAASGLLNREIGGPSVYPPAPEFLFQPPASYGPKTWDYQPGPAQYRRAIYTFRFRSVPYPVLENFDAPRGDTSCVRRAESNTPLQSLTLLNEELFVESARALARETFADGEKKLHTAWRKCVARPPTAAEEKVLTNLYVSEREKLQRDAERVNNILGREPADAETADQSQPPEQADVDLAAWTIACRVLLNLDETITKQ